MQVGGLHEHGAWTRRPGHGTGKLSDEDGFTELLFLTKTPAALQQQKDEALKRNAAGKPCAFGNASSTLRERRDKTRPAHREQPAVKEKGRENRGKGPENRGIGPGEARTAEPRSAPSAGGPSAPGNPGQPRVAPGSPGQPRAAPSSPRRPSAGSYRRAAGPRAPSSRRPLAAGPAAAGGRRRAPGTTRPPPARSPPPAPWRP